MMMMMMIIIIIIIIIYTIYIIFMLLCRVSSHKMLKLCSSEAYLLFYERQDQQSSDVQPVCN